MENSILNSTKEALAIDAGYDAFDTEVLTHINSALGTLDQLGLGPTGGFTVVDATSLWSDLAIVPPSALNMARTYVFIKTKMVFDPPPNKFHLQAYEQQLDQLEWRLHQAVDGQEAVLVPQPPRPIPPDNDEDEEEPWEFL